MEGRTSLKTHVLNDFEFSVCDENMRRHTLGSVRNVTSLPRTGCAEMVPPNILSDVGSS